MKKPKSIRNTGSAVSKRAALVKRRNSSQLPESTEPNMTLRMTVAATAATATTLVRDAAASGGIGSRATPALLAYAIRMLAPRTSAATADPTANRMMRVRVIFTNTPRKPSESYQSRSVYSPRPNENTPNSAISPTTASAHLMSEPIAFGSIAIWSGGPDAEPSSPPLREKSSAIRTCLPTLGTRIIPGARLCVYARANMPAYADGALPMFAYSRSC